MAGVLYDARPFAAPAPLLAAPTLTIAHCSWCLCETAHVQVAEGFWVARGVYKCGGCARRTLQCRRSGCAAFARGRPGWDEDLCFVHREVLPRWPDGADIAYAAAVHERMNPAGHCSWCLQWKRHVLELVTMRGAEVFACGGCARATHWCTSCGEAFCRAGDAQCARCVGLIYDWEATQVNDELTRRTGWCSWCGERCTHLVRDARREHCQCLVCGGGTAPCSRCPGVMRTRSYPSPSGRLGNVVALGMSAAVAAATAAAASVRGGMSAGAARDEGHIAGMGTSWATRQGGSRCMRCEVRATAPGDDAGAVWDAVQARRAAADLAAPYVLDQLQRDSRYKTLAFHTGVFRPFVLLATLPPRERVRLGMRLGIPLARKSGYLDPHAEAWTLLAAPQRGMCARAEGGGAAAAAAEVSQTLDKKS